MDNSDSEIKNFLNAWKTQRNINREIYEIIPEEKFDYRVTPDNPSTKDYLIYQIKNHDNYLKCIKEGVLEFGKHYKELNFEGLSKNDLLKMWDEIDEEIVKFLSSEDRNKMVVVPWNSSPVKAVAAFWGLEGTERYHIGMNSVTLRGLGIDRPPSLVKNYG